MAEDADGETAVRIARTVVEAYTRGKKLPPLKMPPAFAEKGGVFVTLLTYPKADLRGCIGFPSPFFPLEKALVEAARSATEDPRFPRLRVEELEKITVEVSLLTPPEEIVVKRKRDLPSQVRVGVDGLIAARGPERGLLLPQVPVEWKWEAEEFLSQTCMKAGLMPDAWLEPETRMYRFQAVVFSEVAPRGPVVRRVLSPHDRP